MSDFDSIVFDLDGTIWDASASCAVAWNIALKNLGVENRNITADDIRTVSGLPFDECVSTLLSEVSTSSIKSLALEIDTQERVELMRCSGELYEGARAGIERLARTYRLFIVSNCQSWYLQLFLDHHEMRGSFEATLCNGDTGMAKSAMISQVCAVHRLKNPLYIGDTQGDQLACDLAGVEFGFASYGFGESSEAHLRFNSFAEIANAIKSRGHKSRGQST